jgi:hypothetical protein
MAATAVTENTVTYFAFTAPGAKRYWRVQLTTADAAFDEAPFIGELMLGLKMTLPEYLAPSFDPFFRQVEVIGSRSEGGFYLGAVNRGQKHRGNITVGAAGIARSFYTSDLNTFIHDHAMPRFPFIFILDTDDTDFDSAHYIKVTDDSDVKRMAVGGSFTRFALSMDVEEAYMEQAV